MEVLNMMKKINVLMALAAVLALCGIFAACELDTAERVTVTLEDRGAIIKTVTIEKGESLGGSLPETLEGDGSISFYGWFDGASQYFRNTPIGRDLTLTARWADEIATVSFAFTQNDGSGTVIKPAAEIPSVTVVKGEPLGPLVFPAAPRVSGWIFIAWLLDGKPFTQASPVPGDITLTAFWINKQAPVIPPGVDIPADILPPGVDIGADGQPKPVVTYTVTFNPKGGDPVASIKVDAGECIDEWVKPGETSKFPPKPTTNSINPAAFFVAWFDDENREYDGRTPITRNVTLDAKWGLPPYIIDFDKDITKLEGSTDEKYGNVDYSPKVVDSIIDGKRAIVNTVTYDVPYNTNRWRILYRISLKLPSTFSTDFYTRYTIRARFYANKQGAKSWTDETAFTPNKPADEAGYSKEGWLHGVSSQSDDGWGQVSWCSVANWDGQGADAGTMLQRYNLDRKGGTINDTWAPLRSKDLLYPPYLLIQTSDAYIGHIEVYQIVFHNGEWEHTAYEGEEPPAVGED
jgi:hypothetical protein